MSNNFKRWEPPISFSQIRELTNSTSGLSPLTENILNIIATSFPHLNQYHGDLPEFIKRVDAAARSYSFSQKVEQILNN